MKNLITAFVLMLSTFCTAQFTRLPNQLYSFPNLSELNGDTLQVYTVSDTGSLGPLTGTEILEKHQFYLNTNNQVNFSNSIILKDSFPSNTIATVKNSSYNFQVGNLLKYKTSQKSTIWIKDMNASSYDSIYILPILDSNYINTIVNKAEIINNYIYLFGGVRVSAFPYNKSFVIKYNLLNHQFQLNYFDCYSSFCQIYDAIYDSLNGNFIVISSVDFKDTLNPNSTGIGIAKIDTNLTLVPNSVQTLGTNLVLPLLQSPPFEYNANAAIEPINDSTFLIAGEVDNPQNLNSILNLDPYELQDIGVGVRSMNTLQEIMPPQVYGKPDTSEGHFSGSSVFKKIESDFYITANSERLDGGEIYQSWNTSLALHALNDQGDLHWEYYLPFGDYCWPQAILPDENGGLWVTAHCSEPTNNAAFPFGFFTKVAYIDSIAFWPRIGGSVGVNELPKKANELSIYPNPSSGLLTIKQDGLIQQLQFKMTDLNGRVVLESQHKAHNNQLNLERLSKGMYLLNILHEDGRLIKSEKIIKQ